MNILIVFDGTVQSEAALRYGIAKLKEEGGRAVVLNLFPGTVSLGDDAGDEAEALARAEAARQLDEARAMIDESGVGSHVSIEGREGEPAAEILGAAREFGPDVILGPAGYGSIRGRAGVPVITFPGCILVVVDNTSHAKTALGRIAAEAKGTLSKVALLGILPVHMYGASEKDELASLEKETLASLRDVSRALRKEGIETVEAMRPGYPDEEILKAMEGFSASLVMVPMLDDEPSEAVKAAQIIREEHEEDTMPVFLSPVHPARQN